jgi:hypothetical protein
MGRILVTTRHENATMRSLCIVADLQVAVNRIKPYSVAMEIRLVAFALLSNYRMFHTAVNIHVLRSSREVPDVSVRF